MEEVGVKVEVIEEEEIVDGLVMNKCIITYIMNECIITYIIA